MSNTVPIGSRSVPLQHDGELWLSVGASRKSTNWKKEAWSVSDLYWRLRMVKRTEETLDEYRAMTRDQQSDAKDVGGFVGGTLTGTRRQATSVERMSCGMLDADRATEDFLTLMDLQDYSWIAYTTHSHDPEHGKYRWRVVVPYSRSVTPDEHLAIMRRLASWVGFEYFDKTTFEPHRLFYWSSAPVDAEAECEYADRPLLNVDAVLATYGDYRNVAEWPVSMRLEAGLSQDRGRAGDPTTKKGLVGHFCRQWTIPQAMVEFLPGVYEEAAGGRYTFVAGTTRGGAVLYDDERFIYSHHGTDPAAMQLLNAWDLVRIHKFIHMDLEAKEGTPINRMPSQLAMESLVQEHPDIKRQVVEERLGSAREDFPGAGDADTGVTSAEELDGDAWIQQLSLDRHGQLRPTRENYELVLLHDPQLAGRIRFDRFAEGVMGAADLPWLRSETSLEWSDKDDGGLRGYLEKVWGVPPQWGPLLDAFHQVALRQAFHPVQDYLNGLKWDEEKRLDNILTQYLGVESTEFSRVVGRKFLVSAVARVMEPGCKADHTLLLCGGERLGKSFFPRILAGDWYSDSLPHIGGGKDTFEALRGVWMIEIAEMHSTKRADVEQVKHFLTKQSDRYRVAYGRNVAEFKRQCVFLATTNEEQPLVDTTGNRRFWPVKTRMTRPNPEWIAELKVNRDQVWAEAVVAYRAGETLYLSDEMEAVANQIQADHRPEDQWKSLITQWLERPIPIDLYQWDEEQRTRYAATSEMYVGETLLRDKVCVAEIWEECLHGRAVDLDFYRARRINTVMRGLSDWRELTIRHPHYGGGKPMRGYRRAPQDGVTDSAPHQENVTG